MLANDHPIERDLKSLPTLRDRMSLTTLNLDLKPPPTRNSKPDSSARLSLESSLSTTITTIRNHQINPRPNHGNVDVPDTIHGGAGKTSTGTFTPISTIKHQVELLSQLRPAKEQTPIQRVRKDHRVTHITLNQLLPQPGHLRRKGSLTSRLVPAVELHFVQVHRLPVDSHRHQSRVWPVFGFRTQLIQRSRL